MQIGLSMKTEKKTFEILDGFNESPKAQGETEIKKKVFPLL